MHCLKAVHGLPQLRCLVRKVKLHAGEGALWLLAVGGGQRLGAWEQWVGVVMGEAMPAT